MQTLSTIEQVRTILNSERQAQRRIAFVPTMGNLHEGHLTLVREAQKTGDRVVVSIFVNPMQFGANEDLDNYPRTLTEDTEKLLAEGTHYLFTPTAKEMYPNGMASQSQLSVPQLSETLCGASRPGHFTGVATVVSKLFNIVQADVALFGEKDYQQLAVIRKMVQDMCLPIEIIGVPTCRDDDGLALSSRNGYLSSKERAVAPILYKTLCHCRQQLLEGRRDFTALQKQSVAALQEKGFNPDYFALCDAATLSNADLSTNELVILAAASLGNTRLIDNVTLSLNQASI